MPRYPTVLLVTATKAPTFRYIGKIADFIRQLKALQRL